MQHLVIAIALLFTSTSSYSDVVESIDVAKISSTQSTLDTREYFKNELIQRALKATEAEYGSFRIVNNTIP